MRIADLIRARLAELPARHDGVEPARAAARPSGGEVPHQADVTRHRDCDDHADQEQARRIREAREFVFAVYQSFFGREPEGDVHVDSLASGERGYAEFIRGLVEADEFKNKWSRQRRE